MSIGELSEFDLNLLVVLDKLLRTESVKETAKQLNITASAVSHTLSRLRDALGDPILVRAGRKMVPTERAVMLKEPLRRLLADAHALVSSMQPLIVSELQRSFEVVTTDHIIAVLWPELEKLLLQAPGVDVFVQPLRPTLMTELRDGRCHLCIGVFPSASPEMQRRRLFDDRFVCLTREDHPALNGPTMELDAYLELNHVLVSPRGTSHGHIDELLEQRGLTRRVARTVPNFMIASSLLVETDFVTTISYRLARRLAEHFPLQITEPPFALEPYTLSMLWHPRNNEAPAHRWFRQQIIDAANRLVQE